MTEERAAVCGHDNAANASYCSTCGIPAQPTQQEDADYADTEECPACGQGNTPTAQYCDQCGAVMQPDEQQDGDGDIEEPGVSELNSKRPPRDNLVRALPSGMEFRADPDAEVGENVLFGIFSQFNSWYRIDSFWEGSFYERVAPGAFTDTIKNDRSSMRVLFDHGMDPALGNKPLGPIRTLEERDAGPYFEVPLLDTDYNNNFVIPALQGRLMDGSKVGSQLGSSFRFQVQDEEWKQAPKASKRNPEGLPERTITRARVFEFGPVCFPANAGATAQARSLSDEWIGRLVGDPRFLEEFTERVGPLVAKRALAAVPADTRQALVAPKNDPTAVRRRQARALLALSA